MTEPQLEIISPEYYETHGYPHETWTWLRRHDPIRRWDLPDFRRFWSVVRHEDVFAISRDAHRFKNAPRLGVFPAASTATRIRTSASASGSTSAWAHTSRASSCRW